MDNLTFRNASISDVPFLVDTIIEAEKSGTERLSYSTIFELSEDEVRKYLAEMFLEETDGCELSISSFLMAEINGEVAAALSAWIEEINGVPSAFLKGSLLNHILPKESIVKAMKINEIIREIHIEYQPNTIQIGAGYVDRKFRGNNLLRLLTEEIIERLIRKKSGVKTVWLQIFDCNVASLKTYEKANFKIVSFKESLSEEIIRYLPSNKKYLLKKTI